MYLYQNNAEIKLYTILKTLSDKPAHWHALHMKWSASVSPHKEVHIARTLHFIRHVLRNEEGYAFMCEDGDIVILAQGSVQTLIETMLPHLPSMLSPGQSSTPLGENRIYKIYDLTRHWATLLTIAQRKYHALGKNEMPSFLVTPQPEALRPAYH